MDKLVQHIKMDMPGFPKQGLYCYGEASFEANQAMQEPLKKLYKYENQPDMREKIREYIYLSWMQNMTDVRIKQKAF